MAKDKKLTACNQKWERKNRKKFDFIDILIFNLIFECRLSFMLTLETITSLLFFAFLIFLMISFHEIIEDNMKISFFFISCWFLFPFGSLVLEGASELYYLAPWVLFVLREWNPFIFYSFMWVKSYRKKNMHTITAKRWILLVKCVWICVKSAQESDNSHQKKKNKRSKLEWKKQIKNPLTYFIRGLKQIKERWTARFICDRRTLTIHYFSWHFTLNFIKVFAKVINMLNHDIHLRTRSYKKRPHLIPTS